MISALREQTIALLRGFDLSPEAILGWMIWIIALTLVVTLHEVAHGYAAYRLGDPTAKDAGRLTLNPLVHFDMLGALLILMRAPIAWAKPVPIMPARFSRKVPFKVSMIIVSLAGIVTNLVTAFLSHFLANTILTFGITSGVGGFQFFLMNLVRFFALFTQLSVWLAVFNLLPIPPLDGFKFLGQFLPSKAYYWLLERERMIGLIFIFVIVLGRGILQSVLSFLATPIFWLITTPINAFFSLFN